jgi:hypothetical protein
MRFFQCQAPSHLQGDVDTNAAIVGGLMGALHGAGGLPEAMWRPVVARTTGPHLQAGLGRGCG